MVYKSFDKKTRSGASANDELAEELHKPVCKNHTREEGGAKLKISVWYLLMNLKNNYLIQNCSSELIKK